MRQSFLMLCVVALFVTGTAGGTQRVPGPLRGVALPARTGLYLLAADVPPFILDVDSGRVATLRGISVQRPRALSVVAVGAMDAVVVADARGGPKLYSVRGTGGRVTYLGPGTDVWPAHGRRAVWIESRTGRSCTLRQVALDGRVVRAARAFPCATASDPAAGALGLVVKRTRIVDPVSGRTVLRVRSGILAVAGRRVVLDEPHGVGLTVLDTTSGRRRTVRLPRTIGSLGTAAVDPRGRFIALEFGNPSWTSGDGQAFDVWLLDVWSAKLTPLPDLPAFVALKQTNMVWTGDGDLVLLAQSGGKDAVVAWRPRQERLAVKYVRIPDRTDSGSDSFALLR
jgi:hypothetical protein